MNKQHNTCPKCNSIGQSVAAINYNQTQTSEEEGSFSGLGVGMAPTGPTPVFGGGSYGSTNTTQTKLAKIFKEPQKKNDSFYAALGVITIALCGSFILFFLIDYLADNKSKNNENIQSVFNFIHTPLFIYLLIVTTSVATLYYFLTYLKKDNDYNNNIYPKEITRFNELRYCENCHIIFDNNQNHEVASDEGYSKILTKHTTKDIT